MLCFKRLYRTRFFIVLLVTAFAQFLMKGECLSLDIEKELQTFTFWEGQTSEIIFRLNNITYEITLYVSKDGHNQDFGCKLVLTQMTCKKYSGFCQCPPASNESRLRFTFRKQFYVQDSGLWVFGVWDTEVKKLVNIIVHGNTTETTTENPEDEEPLENLTLSPKGDVISIAIIVIATIVIVIAISSIALVCCGPSFVVGTVFRVLTTRGRQRGQSHVSSAQRSQSSVSHDRCPADEDDSEDAQSSRVGSVKEDVTFDSQKSNDTDADVIKETTTLSTSPPLLQPTLDTTPAPLPPPRPRQKPPLPPTLTQLCLALPLQESASEPNPSAPAPPPKPPVTLQSTPPLTDLQRRKLQVLRPSAKPPQSSLFVHDPPARESEPAPGPALEAPAPALPQKLRESQPESPAASERKILQAPKSSKTSRPVQLLPCLEPLTNKSEAAPAPKAPAPPPKPPQPEQTSPEPTLVQSAAVKLLQEEAPAIKPIDPATRIRAPASLLVPTFTQVNSPTTPVTNKPAVAPKPQQLPLLPPKKSAPAPPLAPTMPPKPATPAAPFKPPPLPVSPPRVSPPPPTPKPPVAVLPSEYKEQWLPPQL